MKSAYFPFGAERVAHHLVQFATARNSRDHSKFIFTHDIIPLLMPSAVHSLPRRLSRLPRLRQCCGAKRFPHPSAMICRWAWRCLVFALALGVVPRACLGGRIPQTVIIETDIGTCEGRCR